MLRDTLRHAEELLDVIVQGIKDYKAALRCASANSGLLAEAAWLRDDPTPEPASGN